MTRRLEGKRCIVTGGTKGIGRAIMDRFVSEGARCIVTARSKPETPFADDGSVVFVPGDTSRTDHAAMLVGEAEKAFGGLDVLVNNAGIQIEKTVVETTDEDWERIFGINVRGVFLTCRAAIPVMDRAGGGSIINVGSYDGFLADPGLAAYCATKGAVHALSRAIAVDHGAQNVRCNVICPGWIKTEMMDAYLASVPDPAAAEKTLDANQPIGRVGKPDDIANLALWLASDEAAFTTGQLMVCDGGLTAKASQP